ncbi:hypothetical protein [Oceanobacillus kimchii]|uniref:Uncharacterized protein n=1 Tax=Oceanobacillus kimchii TaxID=746691 RepID=A0ABQ5TJ52_9BACI|nr:hypothetical protein [Oceanobacillus kimchii]GLO65771.1 hypothetical protein MACH08_15550 [Oceanobacillus kimchii]
MFTDTFNNDKSVGEAYAHNLASIMVGVGFTAVGAFLVSNQVGWAAGVISIVTFEFGYKTNY